MLERLAYVLKIGGVIMLGYATFHGLLNLILPLFAYAPNEKEYWDFVIRFMNDPTPVGIDVRWLYLLGALLLAASYVVGGRKAT